MTREILVRVTLPEPPQDVDDLRAAAQAAAAASSVRATAAAIGVSDRGLRKFLDGAAPYSPTLRRLRKWFARHAKPENEQ